MHALHTEGVQLRALRPDRKGNSPQEEGHSGADHLPPRARISLVGGKRENGFRRVRRGVGEGFGASLRLPGGTWGGLWVAGWGRRVWPGRPVGCLKVAGGTP